MKVNKEREQSRLGEIWPKFLREFLIKMKELFQDNIKIYRNRNVAGKGVYIDFNLKKIRSKDIYSALAKLLNNYETTGFLNLLTEKLAEISNLADRFGKCNDIQTRGDSIYRGINRNKPITI